MLAPIEKIPQFTQQGGVAQTGLRPAVRPTQTIHEVVTSGLKALCDGLEFSEEQRDAAIALMHVLLAPWADRLVGTAPQGKSDITDEHFPVEFSVAFEHGVPEIRVLFEAQAAEFNQEKLWEAAWATCEMLETGCNVSLERLHKIADLFKPAVPECRYAMWHCVGFSRSGPPKFKIYLNPLAQGADKASAVVREALDRLGFSSAMQDVFAVDHGELRFFSLDLSCLEDARVKVYRVHHNSTRDEVSSWLKCVPSYDENLVARFWDTIAGDEQHFTRFPVSTYLSLNSRSERPNTATIHFPVRSYAGDDYEVFERVRSFLSADERRLYDGAMAKFATRLLSTGLGLQSYVAVRIHPGAQHTTIYLSPEAYHVVPPRRQQREVARAAC